MSYLETKYINLLSNSLQNFKRKGGNVWNFRCPFCGDSQKSQRKSRGYVYSAGDKLLYSCHNCGLTTSIQKLLKHVNPVLHDEYVKELMLEKYAPKKDEVEELAQQVKKPVFNSFISRLQKVSQLPEGHPCKQYVLQRQIPTKFHDSLFYAPKFMEWTNGLLPGKFSNDSLKYDEPRLVIPFYTKDKKLFGFQGRSLKNLDKDEHRYYTIILDDSAPKVYGLDKVDQTRRYYVLEGPIDSMFIPNAVASAGGELLQTASYLNKKNAVLVFDNEPRHKETVKKIQRAILNGYKVCLWPRSLECKDINEMVTNGIEPRYIKQMIDENTQSGIQAQLNYNVWRRV